MGTIKNDKGAKLKFKLPQFSPTLTVTWICDVINELSNMPYDMILGRDIMKELELDVLSSDMTITMGHIKVPWSDRNAIPSSLFNIESNIDNDDSGDRIKKILDAKYEPANIEEVVHKTALPPNKQTTLKTLLQRYESLFDGTLGTFNMNPYNIELVDNPKTFHLKRAYTVPQAYIQTLKMEVNRLCELGILEKNSNSEWAAGTFIVPKKDGSVRFISDF